jgi:hypothetical protein
MVLVRPSAQLYENMLAILNKNTQYGNSNCISGMDEQLIAETLLTDKTTPIHHIHQEYNWIVGKNTWLPKGVKPKTQQYYHGKPWEEDPEKTKWVDIVQWWDIAHTIIGRAPEDAKWFHLVVNAATYWPDRCNDATNPDCKGPQ